MTTKRHYYYLPQIFSLSTYSVLLKQNDFRNFVRQEDKLMDNIREKKMKNEKVKKLYQKPQIEIIHVQSEQHLMIPVSGTTTPEESQAKEYDFWPEDECDDIWGAYSKSSDLWGDEGQ